VLGITRKRTCMTTTSASLHVQMVRSS
jgi:hypothetical protein